MSAACGARAALYLLHTYCIYLPIYLTYLFLSIYLALNVLLTLLYLIPAGGLPACCAACCLSNSKLWASQPTVGEPASKGAVGPT